PQRTAPDKTNAARSSLFSFPFSLLDSIDANSNGRGTMTPDHSLWERLTTVIQNQARSLGLALTEPMSQEWFTTDWSLATHTRGMYSADEPNLSASAINSSNEMEFMYQTDTEAGMLSDTAPPTPRPSSTSESASSSRVDLTSLMMSQANLVLSQSHHRQLERQRQQRHRQSISRSAEYHHQQGSELATGLTRALADSEAYGRSRGARSWSVGEPETPPRVNHGTSGHDSWLTFTTPTIAATPAGSPLLTPTSTPMATTPAPSSTAMEGSLLPTPSLPSSLAQLMDLVNEYQLRFSNLPNLLPPNWAPQLEFWSPTSLLPPIDIDLEATFESLLPQNLSTLSLRNTMLGAFLLDRLMGNDNNNNNGSGGDGDGDVAGGEGGGGMNRNQPTSVSAPLPTGHRNNNRPLKPFQRMETDSGSESDNRASRERLSHPIATTAVTQQTPIRPKPCRVVDLSYL
ncbi:hypothetical protein H4R33_006746, partial [Dimargaris cristalligena]